MQMPGRKYAQANSGYRYGFGGKEKNDEIVGEGNIFDYGFRIYNPRLGRFLSVDPLAPSFPWYTPYQYAGNKPIWAVDLDGLEETAYTMYLDRVFSNPKTAAKFHEDMKPLQKPAMYVTGALAVATLAVIAPETLPFIFRGAMWASNPVNQGLAVTIGGFALEMINPDPNYSINLPGPGDELGKAVKLLFKTKASKTVEAVIQQSARFANQSEVKWFGKLLSEGKNVTLLAEKANQKNADFIVNGVVTELKTITGVKNESGKIAQAINDRIKRASKQARSIIVDVTEQAGASIDVVKQGLKKYWGQGSKDAIRVVGKDFDQTFTKADLLPTKTTKNP